ncbi:MAG: GTPase HflX [Chromatiales bacterium]|jgi:GTP-binding protein HflX
MFERPQTGERAVLVHLALGHALDPDEVSEFRELAVSAGAEPVAVVSGNRRNPDPRLFVGRGKAEEIRSLIETEQADLVIFDHALSPSQERNLEAYFKCRVLDRSGLILDIFAQRARSFEGKLQVELAQLRHLSTRLVRGWTHLERQKGGIGLRGPGETQLETDRRLLNARITQIRKRLEKVESQRHQGRRARERAEIPTVALVGYTNAGKSTIFNQLTEAGVYARDQLFATLDPTLRRLELEHGAAVVLADTVGFISKLPHELIAAFKSTLQETAEADLLLHVIDDASHRRQQCIDEVNDVLHQIGADAVPQIRVYNKIDLVQDEKPRKEYADDGLPRAVWVSAATGQGMDLLVVALSEFFQSEHVCKSIALQPADGRVRAMLYKNGQVVKEIVNTDGGWQIDVEMTRRDYEQMLKRDADFARAVAG